jgi:hypothetical protein
MHSLSTNKGCIKCRARQGRCMHLDQMVTTLIVPFGMLIIGVLLLSLVGGCKTMPEDMGSAYAREAGDPTMGVGGCIRPLATGWEGCIVEEKAPAPTVRLYFVNPAQWSITDCHNQIFKHGAVGGPAEVLIDLAPINDQIQRDRFCLLNVEAIEFYPNPDAKDQMKEIPLMGGFHISVVDQGYMPIPNPNLIAFCVKFKRTTKGRTVIERCD